MPHVAVVLWHIEVSHYNEKARWALDYKGVPYSSRVPMPGLHRVSALIATRGKHQRLPVVEIDGRRIGDSTAIIAALEEYAPEPPLYPADPDERERALALEDWFDEELGPELRRFVWHHTLPDTALVAADAVLATQSLSRAVPAGERAGRADPRAARLRLTNETAGRGRDAVVAAMDRLESELGGADYLAGDGFTVADLTAASLFTPLLTPPERPYAPSAVAPAVQDLRDELMVRPGGEWVARMYARHRNRHVTERVDALSH